DRGAGSAVIGLVDTCGADRQWAHRNVRRRAGAGRSQLIIAGGGAGERQAGGGDGPGGAGRFGGEAGSAAAQADVVACQCAGQSTGGDGSGSRAVINLVISGDGARDDGWVHIEGAAQRAGQAAAAGT